LKEAYFTDKKRMAELEVERSELKKEQERLNKEKTVVQKKKLEIELELEDKLTCLTTLLVKIRTSVLDKMSGFIHQRITNNIKHVITKQIDDYILMPINRYQQRQEEVRRMADVS
jgi:hypothetical protein